MPERESVILNGVATSELREVVLGELVGLENPEAFLAVRLKNWLAREPTRHRPNLVLAGKVKDKLASGDSVGALLSIAEGLGEIPVTHSEKRTVRKLKGKVGAVVSGAKEITTGRASVTFGLGGASHRLREKMAFFENPTDILDDDYDLIYCYGLVTGMIEKTQKVSTQAKAIQLDFSHAAGANLPSVNGDGSEYPPKIISFEYPFKIPKENENKLEWGYKALSACLNMLSEISGGLPSKKYDVAQIFQSPEALKVLMQTLEISHWLLGVNHDLSLVQWDGDKGSIKAESVKEFQVLNWLAIARAFVETASGQVSVHGNEAIIIEIPDGKTRLVIPANGGDSGDNKELEDLIEAKKIDILRLSWKSEQDEIDILHDLLRRAPVEDDITSGVEIDPILDFEAYLAYLRKFESAGNLKESTNNFRNLINGQYKDLFLDLVGGDKEPDFTRLTHGNYKFARAILRYASVHDKHWEGEFFIDKCDIKPEIVVEWQRQLEDRIKVGNLELSLREAVSQIQSKFNSQERRYRRKGVDRNGRDSEVSTRNFRNVRNLFRELYRLYGDRIFTDLVIEIDDLKFPAGDGGWFTQFSDEDLPLPEHMSQVSGYIFRVLAQLYWVERWAKQELVPTDQNLPQAGETVGFSSMFSEVSAEDLPVRLEDVAEFILKRGVYDRVIGRVLYQTPTKEIVKRVLLPPDGDELISWSKQAYKLDKQRKDLRPRIRVLRALYRVLEPEINELRVIKREGKKMPEFLSLICLEDEGQVFLCVDKLEKYLNERLQNGESTITNAVDFTEGVRVIWIDKFSSEIPFLKIAVDKLGNFSIHGIREWYGDGEEAQELITQGISTRGELLTVSTNYGVRESSQHKIGAFDRGIWGKLGGLWPLKVRFSSKDVVLKRPVGATDLYVNQDKDDDDTVYLVYPDGSMPKKVRGKPRVCTWDPMGPTILRLDMDLLTAANETSSDRSDRWKLGELQNELAKRAETGEISEVQIMCPAEGHANERTKAARLYGDHITCFREHIAIALPDLGSKVERVPTTGGLDVNDYKGVSREREKTFASFMNVANIFAESSPLPRTYLEEERGLSTDDLPGFGFVPLELDKAITKLLTTSTFKVQLKGGAGVRLDQLAVWLARGDVEKDPAAFEACKRILLIADELPVDKREEVIKSLTLGSLESMRRRNIWEAHKKKGKPEFAIQNRKGNRIILPTFWFSEEKEGEDSLVNANVNARGIKIGEEEYFLGEPHHKAVLGFTRKKKPGTDLRLRRTPAGFWLADPQGFIKELDDTLIVFEGPLNPPSFWRMIASTHPELKNISLTNVGLGYRELTALIKWFNTTMGKRIKYMFFATDLDGPGIEAFYRYKDRFQRAFDGLSVLPIHELLPVEVREILPPLDPKLFDEDGIFYGMELDLNDLIRKHSPNWSLGMDLKPENKVLIEELRQRVGQVRLKYAHFPQK